MFKKIILSATTIEDRKLPKIWNINLEDDHTRSHHPIEALKSMKLYKNPKRTEAFFNKT